MISIEEFKIRHAEQVEEQREERERRADVVGQLRALCILSRYELRPAIEPGLWEVCDPRGECIRGSEYELAAVLAQQDGAYAHEYSR